MKATGGDSLAVVRASGDLAVFSVQHRPGVDAGDTIWSFVPPDDPQARMETREASCSFFPPRDETGLARPRRLMRDIGHKLAQLNSARRPRRLERAHPIEPPSHQPLNAHRIQDEELRGHPALPIP